jgi:four helix bundle protein
MNARGSLLELDTHLELAFRINYLNKEKYQALRNELDEIGRIVNGLIRSINM